MLPVRTPLLCTVLSFLGGFKDFLMTMEFISLVHFSFWARKPMRSLGQFLPDILQMLTIQRVQIRPSSPVDMCCLHEERYQQVCSVQESLSGSASTRPHAQLLLLCLGIPLHSMWSCACGEKSSVFIRRLKMRYYLREIKSWGIAQTIRAPVFSAVATSQ